jgi:hypothetical protein
MGAKPPEPHNLKARDAGKPAVFEAAALVLLSLATVGTAWCSFQAASWAGVSQRLTNLSAVVGRRAVTAELQAGQTALLDVSLFSQYVNARASSNETLARFYLLASALFCGGTASKFDALWIRRTVLAFGLGAFAFAVARLLVLPVQH